MSCNCETTNDCGDTTCGCKIELDSLCVRYLGGDLPYLDVIKGTRIEDVLGKIEVAVEGLNTDVLDITNNYTALEIGTWDMDTQASKVIAHGLSATEWKTIHGVNVIIKNDADDIYYPIDTHATLSAPQGGVTSIDSGSITLERLTAGLFDDVTFSLAVLSRGVISFHYTKDI